MGNCTQKPRRNKQPSSISFSQGSEIIYLKHQPQQLSQFSQPCENKQSKNFDTLTIQTENENGKQQQIQIQLDYFIDSNLPVDLQIEQYSTQIRRDLNYSTQMTNIVSNKRVGQIIYDFLKHGNLDIVNQKTITV